MNERIKNLKETMRKFHIETPDWRIDDEVVLDLIAHIERLEAVVEKANEIDYNNLILFLTGFAGIVRSGDESEFWQLVIKELDALQQALQAVKEGE